MADLVIGVDLGGTNIKAGIIDADGRVIERHRIETQAHEGPQAVARRIGRAALECVEKAGADPADVKGIGIGSPGTLDIANGIVLFSPNLPGFRDVPLLKLIEEDVSLPCSLENDANAAALAEQWVGAGRGASSLGLLTLGTGIGGGIVLDGQVWHGGNGVAGEVGHMSINPDGVRCACGNTGCFEAYASATAMVRRMREAIEAGADSILAADPDSITARSIHQAALAGDVPALRNIEETGRYIGGGVSNLMHLLNPEVFAFSGGVTAAGNMLMDPLLDEVEKRTLEASRKGVRVCFAELPEDAGIIGAARSAMLAPG